MALGLPPLTTQNVCVSALWRQSGCRDVSRPATQIVGGKPGYQFFTSLNICQLIPLHHGYRPPEEKG
jgi:hypothetical protein